MIERLQTGANNAVKVMSQGRTQAQSSVEQTMRAGESFESIVRAISTINNMNTQIASTAVEQSAVADEIDKNIINISHVAETTAKGASRAAENSEYLAKQARQLREMVDQFKV